MDGFGRPVPIELRMLLKNPIHPIRESGLFRIVNRRLSHGREKRPSEGSPELTILAVRNMETQIPRSGGSVLIWANTLKAICSLYFMRSGLQPRRSSSHGLGL